MHSGAEVKSNCLHNTEAAACVIQPSLCFKLANLTTKPSGVLATEIM